MEGNKSQLEQTVSSSNLYHFPEGELFDGLTYNGLPVFKFPIAIEPIIQIDRVRNLPMRSDDVLITAYTNCGCNWLSQLLQTLTSKPTNHALKTKECTVIEMTKDLSSLDQMTSPRVLTSHLYMRHLPEQVLEKKVKLVHLNRNPKDCAVSYYHHMKKVAPDQFNFDNFIRGYTTDGYMSRSHQPNYFRQFSKFVQDNPDHPIFHIHYEELKKDPLPILQELARFVGIRASRKFCQDVVSACGLEQVEQVEETRNFPDVIGNWKNTFTVAQSEIFDQFMVQQKEQGLPYIFLWEENKDERISDTNSEVISKQQKSAPFRANPFHFPERNVFQGITYNDVPIFMTPRMVDPIKQIKNVRSLAMRNDDIIISAFAKCGTHWVFEILQMLLSGTTDYSSRTKEFTMIEFIDDTTALEQIKSPRLLNSHMYIAHLPEQILDKRVKLVHLIRNPRDCAVSFYYHMKQYAKDKLFNFDNFIKGYTTEGYTTMSHQLNYLRQFSKFEKDNPDHPIIHIYYEDLKENPVPIVEELASFVGVQADRKFCQDVVSACGFDKLKQADKSRDMPKRVAEALGSNFLVYRKGVVGDWKNTFTVAQSELFDHFMTKQEEKGIPYTFREQ